MIFTEDWRKNYHVLFSIEKKSQPCYPQFLAKQRSEALTLTTDQSFSFSRECSLRGSQKPPWVKIIFPQISHLDIIFQKQNMIFALKINPPAEEDFLAHGTEEFFCSRPRGVHLIICK